MSGRSSYTGRLQFFQYVRMFHLFVLVLNFFLFELVYMFRVLTNKISSGRAGVELTHTDFILMISDILNLNSNLPIFGYTLKKAQGRRKSQEKEQYAVSSTSKTTAPSPDAIHTKS